MLLSVCVLGTDSEESECSSLERDKNKDLYSKVNRKPTPHKKKHKQKGTEGPYITQINIDHRRQSDQDRVHDLEHGIRGKMFFTTLSNCNVALVFSSEKAS